MGKLWVRGYGGVKKLFKPVMGDDLSDAKAVAEILENKESSQYSDTDVAEILRQGDSHSLVKMMPDSPKVFVHVTIQGECLIHRRDQPLKKQSQGRKRPILRGFDSAVPDDEDV